MPWQNAGMNGEMPLGADQLTPPAAQPPAAAPLSPQDRYAALVAFANGSGPKPAWYGQQSGGSNPQTAELAATGRYDPTQLSQVMGPPTAAAPPPAGAQAPPAIATAPPWLQLGAMVAVSPALAGFAIGLTLATGLLTGL